MLKIDHLGIQVVERKRERERERTQSRGGTRSTRRDQSWGEPHNDREQGLAERHPRAVTAKIATEGVECTLTCEPEGHTPINEL